jgi:hypothetical protein
MQIQMTLYSTKQGLKPMSTIVEVDSLEEFKTNLSKYKSKALSKISAQRYMPGNAIIKNGYTTMKWRIYNEQERKQQAKADFIKQFFEKRGMKND